MQLRVLVLKLMGVRGCRAVVMVSLVLAAFFLSTLVLARGRAPAPLVLVAAFVLAPLRLAVVLLAAVAFRRSRSRTLSPSSTCSTVARPCPLQPHALR